MIRAVICLALAAIASAQLLPPRPVVGRNCQAHLAQVELSQLVGQWKPKCDADGTYAAMQIHASIGMSFCVDKLGQTIVSPQRGLKACQCPRERAEKLQLHLIGGRVPQCETDGTYTALQVDGSTGYSRCVSEDGSLIHQFNTRGVKVCKCIRQRQMATGAAIGQYKPQCNDETGNYNPRQSHPSTGYSWCVDLEGEQVGDAVRPGQANTLQC